METRYSVSNLFNQPTSTDYIPHLMVHCPKEGIYKSPKLSCTIHNLQLENGNKNIFEAKTIVDDLTPSHLAVMAENIAGLKFLLKHNVSVEHQDAFGKKPIHYCQIGSNIYKCLTEYSERISDFEKLLEKRKVTLPDTPFTYQAPHDFGIKFDKLLFKRSTPDNVSDAFYVKVDNFPKNMEEIAKKEGFELVLSMTNCIPRDSFIPLSDGSYKMPCNSANIQNAIDKYDSLTFLSPLSDITCSEHVHFVMSGLGGTNNFKDIFPYDYTKNFPLRKDPFLDIYLEGGNYFILTNSKNKKVILMGEDQLYVALNHLRLDKYFDKYKEQLAERSQQFATSLTLKEMRASLEEMYAQGLLKQSESCPKGFISFPEKKEIINDVLHDKISVKSKKAKLLQNIPIEKTPYLNRAKELKLYIPLKLDDKDVENCKNVVAKYLAQKEMTKELIAQNLGGEKEDLHFITKLSLHLDQVLHPGPKGSMFVQDFTYGIDVLEHIKRYSKSYELTALDLQILERLLYAMRRLEIQTKPLVEKIHQELEQAGIIVIPSPGAFFDISPHWLSPENYKKVQTFNVNFFNSITGKSPNSEFFWITTGASVGNNLGIALMSRFEKFLNSHQKMAVHYIGYDPQNPSDFSEGMRPWNEEANGTGPHCMSVELETHSHTHS